jgi:hypothetical protein
MTCEKMNIAGIKQEGLYPSPLGVAVREGLRVAAAISSVAFSLQKRHAKVNITSVNLRVATQRPRSDIVVSVFDALAPDA